MAEATQYSLSLKELIEVIIKKSDIHQGRWSLTLGIQIGVGNFGPTPEQSLPGATVTIHQVGIQKVEPGTPTQPGSIIVDAAKVNPKKKAK